MSACTATAFPSLKVGILSEHLVPTGRVHIHLLLCLNIMEICGGSHTHLLNNIRNIYTAEHERTRQHSPDYEHIRSHRLLWVDEKRERMTSLHENRCKIEI